MRKFIVATVLATGLLASGLAVTGASAGVTAPSGAVTVGPRGPAGPQGPRGFTGATGQRGQRGLLGEIGTTGADGPAGVAGPVGPTGATGPAGVTGPAGPQGIQGVAGPVGPAGASVGETFTVFSQDFPPNNAVYVGGQVWCPAGSQLTGGGYVIDNFTSHPIQATGSYPVGNSWTAFLTNVPSYTYSEDSGITVYAICAS